MKSFIQHISILILGLPFLFLASCKKEVIKDPVVNSSPVFLANVSLGEEQFTLEAGVNDALMSTFTTLHNGVNRFSGRLGTDESFLEMGIYQGDLDLNEPFSLSNFQGNLPFTEATTQTLVEISKENFPNSANIQQIVWFVDGVEVGLNTLSINEPGKYQVCAEVHFYQGEVSTLCNELYVGYYTNAQCRIRHFVNANNQLKVWVDEESSAIESIEWSLDGAKIAESNLLELTIDQNKHYIASVIYFKNGSTRRKTILVDGSQSGQFIDDFSHVEDEITNQIRWDYSVLIQLKRNGKNYTSLGASDEESTVQLIEIEYYGLNDQGKHVYKCEGLVNTFVKELSSGEIVPLSFTAKFGLELN